MSLQAPPAKSSMRSRQPHLPSLSPARQLIRFELAPDVRVSPNGYRAVISNLSTSPPQATSMHAAAVRDIKPAPSLAPSPSLSSIHAHSIHSLIHSLIHSFIHFTTQAGLFHSTAFDRLFHTHFFDISTFNSSALQHTLISPSLQRTFRNQPCSSSPSFFLLPAPP